MKINAAIESDSPGGFHLGKIGSMMSRLAGRVNSDAAKFRGITMQQTFLVLATVGAFLSCDGVQDAAKRDNEKLQGLWGATEMTSAGKKTEREVRMHFDGNKVVMVSEGEGSVNGTFTISPEKSPAAMDVTAKEAGNSITIPLIYEFKDDELKLCHFIDRKGRPNVLEATDKTVLIILKRKKP